MRELENSELIEVDGGLLFLAAIPLAKVFIWGVATGLAIGTVLGARDITYRGNKQ